MNALETTLIAPTPISHRDLPSRNDSIIKSTTGKPIRKPTPLPSPPVTPPPTVLRYTIPDFIAYSPFPIRINPHYKPVSDQSLKWFEDNNIIPAGRKREAYKAMDFGLLAAMAYPDADAERFRIVCDYMSALFAFDDLTDLGGLREDAQATKSAADVVMNSLYHPLTYDSDFRCGQVFGDFWDRALKIGCSPGANQRFLEYMDLYLQAIHEQVINRTKSKYIPDIEGYIKLRRDTGACKTAFALAEFALELDIPAEVFAHPDIKLLEDLTNDVIVLSNDVYSYVNEHAAGDNCNIIDVAMKEKGLDLQGAMNFAGDLGKGRIDVYVATKAKLPSWGPRVDSDVRKYLLMLEDWMAAGLYWSFESTRYFGTKGREIAKTLVVEIPINVPSRPATSTSRQLVAAPSPSLFSFSASLSLILSSIQAIILHIFSSVYVF